MCYEAGPCGYGVHRQLTSLGHRCDVVAPSLIPHKPGDRVKTDRRDATMLARLHRAGELTPVWVPDADHEAMRDLIRLRSVVRQIVIRARQHLQGFLLRHGRNHGRGKAWRMAYRRWLSTLAFEHPAQQIAFQDYVDAVMDAERRLKRVEEQISGLLPEWNLRPVVDALQAMRGFVERQRQLGLEAHDGWPGPRRWVPTCRGRGSDAFAPGSADGRVEVARAAGWADAGWAVAGWTDAGAGVEPFCKSRASRR